MFSAALAATMSVDATALQPLGTFHGNSAVARDGEAWLALRLDGDDAALVATKVQVRKITEGDEEETEVAATVPDAMMLVRGKGLAEGAVPVAPIADSNAAEHALPLGERRFDVRTVCVDDGERGGQLRVKCEVRLQEGAKQQVLLRMDGYREAANPAPVIADEKAPKLLFAGDLDRDGALDLIMDTASRSNVSKPTLYLSSKAGEGELVGEAATNETTGC
ncbi:hypothetical protein LF41_2967 [Lysobacter dokdonensis DS-58]|uniref:Uncharacterized protein n=1 Tax=Lysobacter dokdonensis DS-58 TaxID=1300345 RepID=A0A0A2WKR4_9GAMM|nr:hypothetical protein LF41_2967 [Lysobacter dokdonensis DS-58]